MDQTPSIFEILKYFGLEDKIPVKSLTQGIIIYLVKRYYLEINSK